eukprot:PLAT3824.3.p1 GENE.PLAT3824.3~~PLAT3824.3.p1  ORF type:complete len:415 (+),score=183.39 PLAT3824.3:155-1246(+)
MEEERRVMYIGTADPIMVMHVAKVHNNHTIVADVTLGVKAGEIVAIVGPDGAGKSSLLRMLAGEQLATAGTAMLDGVPSCLLRQYDSAVGYCPQSDSMFMSLTGRDNLLYFARLRGVPSGELASHCDMWLQELALGEVSDKAVRLYSGCERRRLTLALALLGTPDILLLDEPTRGMSLPARRRVWALLSNYAKDRSVLLATHMMEEAVALATRIGVLVNGKLECLGTAKRLREKFGQSYVLEVFATPRWMTEVREFIRALCPKAELQLQHGGRLRMTLPERGLPMAKLFAALEANRGPLSISSYELSKFTLDQLFMTLARKQEEQVAGGATGLRQSAASLRDTPPEESVGDDDDDDDDDKGGK